jgi:hypothetical protein
MAQHITVPAFFDIGSKFNNNDSWDTVVQAKGCVSLTVADRSVITNVSDARKKFRECRDAGQKVLGYVMTATTTRPKADITADIEYYYNNYAKDDNGMPLLGGIFFDVGPSFNSTSAPSEQDQKAWYEDVIVQRFKMNAPTGQSTAFLNSPQFPFEWVMTDIGADYVILWEERQATYVSSFVGIWPGSKPFPPGGTQPQAPSWWSKAEYTDRIVHVVHQCPLDKVQDTIDKSKQRNAGHIYIYDGNSGCAPPNTCPDPQDPVGHPQGGYWRLPTYWNQLVTEVCVPVAGDTQAPVTTCAISPVPNAAGWNNSDVTVTLHATDNLGGSGVDHITYSVNGVPKPQVPGDTATFQVATEGETTITFAATDKASPNPNTEMPKKSCTVRLDKTAPAVAIAVPADGATYTLNQQVSASYSCSPDAVSGSKTCSGTVPNGSPIDTSSYGTKTFTVTAEDNAGNKTTKTITYNVFFNFSGFFPPVDNWPKLNQRKAGSNVPVKFSLGGNQGLDIFAQGYPKSQEIPCNNPNVEVAGTDPTTSPGGSGLTYDAGSDQYHYNWKTEKGWEGSCRQLVVKLKDGSFHRANFQFT